MRPVFPNRQATRRPTNKTITAAERLIVLASCTAFQPGRLILRPFREVFESPIRLLLSPYKAPLKPLLSLYYAPIKPY